MIRDAKQSDLDACVDLARDVYGKFLEESGIEIVLSDIVITTEKMIDLKQVIVLEHDGEVVGMVAYVIAGHPANYRVKIIQELLWCCKGVHVTDGLSLLRAFEERAEKEKADIVIIANLHEHQSERLDKIYRKMGYKFMETHYVRSRK